MPQRALLVVLALSGMVQAAPIVNGLLDASLTTGSLAGVTFPVSFSYDAGQVQPVGDSFIGFMSIDFTLLGTPFHKSDISQGGQVIFRNGVIDNVTASFQNPMPPTSPVSNITLGFGGPGIIGYIDRNGTFGAGTFTFTAVAAPEPGAFPTMGIGLLALFAIWNRARAPR